MTPLLVDALVVGGGPTGLAAAIAIAAEGGARVHLVSAGQLPAATDLRTTALFPPSLNFLESLGLDLRQNPATAALTAIRIVDRTGWLLKAPEILFEAAELDLDAFGINTPNAVLVTELLRLARKSPSLSIDSGLSVARLSPGPEHVLAELSDGRLVSAKLVVGADGRQSLCRMAAGLSAEERSLDQAALVCSFDHALPHNGVSTEFHRDAGPLTTVPLPGNASSLVWVDRPNIIKRLAAMTDDDFAGALREHIGSMTGAIDKIGPRRTFPLIELQAKEVAAERIALIGEAAHVMPPIGAQGLNLGFRDAAILADSIGRALANGTDPGSARVLADYSTARVSDIRLRQTAIHWLNDSLAAGSLPLQLLRGAGLHALQTIGPLRREVMRRGLGLSPRLPPRMQASRSRPIVAGESRPAAAH